LREYAVIINALQCQFNIDLRLSQHTSLTSSDQLHQLSVQDGYFSIKYILLCILYQICCIWTVTKITNIPQDRYQSYKKMNIFLIRCLKILIVLTLRTFVSNWFHNLTSIILTEINFLFVLQNFTFNVYLLVFWKFFAGW